MATFRRGDVTETCKTTISYSQKNGERNIGHNQVEYDVAEQSSVALVALEIVGISRDRVVVLTVSTQSSFTIEIATELLVLPGNILIHFSVHSSTSIVWQMVRADLVELSHKPVFLSV